MADKTRLELDLEHRERYRTSLGIKGLIVVLIVALAGAGMYAYTLKKELMTRDAEMALVKENFQKEKVELLSKFKRFQLEDDD